MNMIETYIREGDCIEPTRKLDDNTVTSTTYNKKKISSSQKQMDKKYIPGVNTNGVMKKIEHDSYSD